MGSHCKWIGDLPKQFLCFLPGLLYLRIIVDLLKDLRSGNVFPFDVFDQDSGLVCQKRPKDQIDVQIIWVNLLLVFEVVIYEVGTPEKLLSHELGRDHQNRGSDQIVQ